MANGFFLGGLAEGQANFRASQRAEKEIGLRERALGLEEDQLRRQAEQEGVKAAQERVSDTAARIKEVVEAAKARDAGQREIARAIAPLVKSVTQRTGGGQSIIEAAGMDPSSFATQIDSLIQAPTASEKARMKGQQEATTALSQAETISRETGAPQEEALEAQGALPAPRNIVVRTFRMPNGQFKSVRADNEEQINRVINEGGVETPVSVQAGSTDALSGRSKGEVQASREALRGFNADLEEIDNAIGKFENAPEASGLTGVIIENAGGIIDQLGQFAGKENLTEEITGVDTGEVQAARTQARATISRMLTAITNEDSGRFTDTERQIAERTLKALDATSSMQQVQGAFTTMRQIVVRARTREVDELRTAADISLKDLTTDEGINRMGEVLMDNGFTMDQALESVNDMMRRNNIQVEGVGG